MTRLSARVGAVVAVVVTVGACGPRVPPPAADPVQAPPGPVAAAPVSAADAVPAVPPPFALVGGMGLHPVSHRVRAVAFHEASLPGSMALHPLGRCRVCRNRAKFTPPPVEGEGTYIVVDSRGRRYPATSAVDVVLPRRAVVRAPVSGVVREVRRYRLYGRYPDVRVTIVPDALPTAYVVMLHLAGAVVRPGDRVAASSTPIARVRQLPFESHVDRYVKSPSPHVHIEVKDRAPRAPSK